MVFSVYSPLNRVGALALVSFLLPAVAASLLRGVNRLPGLSQVSGCVNCVSPEVWPSTLALFVLWAGRYASSGSGRK